MNVLVVDDEPSVANQVSLEVKSLGHYPIVCVDIGQALIEAQNRPIDSVITDKNLGGSRGLEPLVAKIRQRPDYVKILVLTGEPYSPGIKEELGVDAFVEKGKSDTFDRIDKFLES